MEQTREIIVRLLSSMGSRKEVEQYLKEFSSVDSRKFAIVKVGGGTLRDELDELASALTFLQRVGLYPIVIHGAGPQLNEALEHAGIATKRIDGMRITEKETLEVARRIFMRENLRLVEALEDLGTRARPLTSGIFEATYMDQENLGFVGDVSKVHLDPIASAIRSGNLPILAPLGETKTGQIVNINADVAARELARRIEPYKVVFLTPTGGLLNAESQVISSINLSEEYDDLMKQPWIEGGMRLKLQEIKELLDVLPLDSSVSITASDQLARELFTHRGSGTLVRRGERILTFDGWEGIDRERLTELLEHCFGKELVDGYFDDLQPSKVFLTENYRATAIVTEHGGVPYLDKFAVTPRAQGEGLGRSVWVRMKEACPSLFWRSRSINPINGWYFQQSDGSYRHDPWTVFWYGVDGFDEMRRCVDIALDLPATIQ